jgi:hypothetical protein
MLAYIYMPDINVAVTCFETCLLVEKGTMSIFDISDILFEGQNKWICNDRLKYDLAPCLSACDSCYYLYDIKYSASKNHVIKTSYLELQTYCSLQIIGDVTKEDTLDPKLFKGIKKVVNAVSVIVGPKEGDTPDRQKYKQVCHILNIMIGRICALYHLATWVWHFSLEFMQGIKFFEPEVGYQKVFSCIISSTWFS